MAASSTNYDITVERGTDLAVVAWELDDEQGTDLPLSLADVLLIVAWGGGYLELSPGSTLKVDIETSVVTWTPTIAERQIFPLGPVARYELFVKAGGKTYRAVQGVVNCVGTIARTTI